MAQYFGSRLQLTPHLHVLVPEVVWGEAGQPVELPPPDEGAVEAVLVRAVLQLARRWPSEEDEYRQLQQAAVQERLALEVPPRRRRGLVAVVAGFSLHAGTWVHGNDRQGLEWLVRYGARGPVAESRLSRLADGRYRYAPKGDGPGVDFTAEALVKRLVALLPPARKHLTTFHGVYASNARLGPLVMRSVADAHALPLKPQAELKLAAEGLPPPAQRPPRLDWATLQARTFGNDVWSCPCGGRRHVLALVTSPSTAEEVLHRLGLLEPRRAFRHHGPAPDAPIASRWSGFCLSEWCCERALRDV